MDAITLARYKTVRTDEDENRTIVIIHFKFHEDKKACLLTRWRRRKRSGYYLGKEDGLTNCFGDLP